MGCSLRTPFHKALILTFFETIFGGEQEMRGFVELRIGGTKQIHCKWMSLEEALSKDTPRNVPAAFFGPAVRKQRGELGKDNFKASLVCWVDVDSLMQPRPILPPTALVWSGHGWHLYWKFNKWCDNLDQLEVVNSMVAQHVDADSCQNADRIMRLPGTINTKDPNSPVNCKLIELHPERVYSIEILMESCRLEDKVVARIRNGDRRGFPSRSERDWNIVRALVEAGLSDDEVRWVFESHECGDKYRDPKTDHPDRYLSHTIDRARRRVTQKARAAQVIVDEKGMYIKSGKGTRHVSTFGLEPTLLLEGETEDSIMCDVRAAGTDHVWKHVVFPVSAFASSHSLIRVLTKAAWVWLGRDADVRLMQTYLMAELQNKGVPRAVATGVIGRHRIDGDNREYFVTHNCVMASDGSVWAPSEAPIVYVDSGRETPIVHITDTAPDPDLLEHIADVLPKVNTSGVIWPMLGWFMATPMKPAIEEFGYRFPSLNVFGTRGSGKSTTISRVFHAMLGYKEERSYDAGTTRFVTLTLLGCANAVPVGFSEFRVATAEGFTRYILLAYDTGRDPRGRADQTTVDYPLTAPFSVDGEDMVEDPASIERVVAVRMIPATIAEGSDCWMAFDELQSVGNLEDFAGPFYMHALQIDVGALIDAAEQDIWEAFPGQLPTRVRKNLTVVWMGVRSFVAFMRTNGVACAPAEGALVLADALGNVYSTTLGRAPTEADSFIEVVINAAARNVRSFPWDLADGVLWFQLMPAFEYYVGQRAHQRRATLSRRAIKSQLLELADEFVVAPEVRELKQKKVMAYGVDLMRAHDAGLDIPASIKRKVVTIDLSE